MLASFAASRVAKLVATCVCPVVGAASLTMAVPKVRNAVHNATAPREYALPKTRERMPEAEPLALAAPCADVGTPNLAHGFVEGMQPVPDQYSVLPDTLPTGGGRLPFASGGPDDPGGGGNPGGGGVPEPHAWLQMLLGLFLVGGSIRLAARSGEAPEDAELLARLEDFKKDVRQ